MYGNAATQRVMSGSEPVVYLYGGYEGFDNLGDVLQLKGTIAFHRSVSTSPVVIVLSLSAFTHDRVGEQISEHFDADGILWEDGDRLGVENLDLTEVQEVMAGGLLHVYGGDYFNRYWGERRAFVAEQLVHRLHVRDYIVTGIQVDEPGAQHLRALFQSKTPLAVAARDEGSRRLIQDAFDGVEVRNSFDDAVEPITWLRDQLASFGIESDQGRPAIGVHLNTTSEYMVDAQAQSIRSLLSAAHTAFPDYGMVLLNAYNDRRPVIADSVRSLDRLALTEEYTHFDVVNLASIAAARAVPRSQLRDVATALSRVAFVITSSYHVALIMNFLGRPTYLIATNDYYTQKRESLGLPDSIEEFLNDPRAHLNAFATERRDRVEWMSDLATLVASTLAAGTSGTWSTINAANQPLGGDALDRYRVG